MLKIMRTAMLGGLVLLTGSLEARSIVGTAGATSIATRVGQVLALGGLALVLSCTQIGCGGDSLEEADAVVRVQDTEVEHSDGGIELEKPYSINDYIGRYVVFISDGAGDIDSGLVIGHIGQFGELIVVPKPQKHMPVKKQQEWGNIEIELVAVGGETHVPLRTIIGVMDAKHDDLGAVVEFDPAQARSQLHLFFAEDEQQPVLRLNDDGAELIPPDVLEPPTLVRGVVRAVYLEPMHSSAARVAIVNVEAQFGFSNAEWQRLLPDNAYVPYAALTHLE